MDSDGIYFITFTCHKWLPLVHLTNSYDRIYKWFDYLKSWGHYINGYVIMPNHIHAILAFRNTGKTINTIIGNGKRLIAYEVVNKLKQYGHYDLLNQLNLAVESKDRQRGKIHEIWEDSFDWKECRTHRFIKQKLDYIHNNPCQGKWNLAPSPAEYNHSSARFYMTGEHAAYVVTSYLELDDIDLTHQVS